MDIKILAIVPARCGSKGFPHKNIVDFKGKPLMAWSIEQAIHSKYKMRVVVSTDSEEYASIARSYGAETPFLRPKEISQDLSTTYECIEHCLNYLKDNENYVPDICVILQPTSPTRKIDDLNKCMDLFLENRNNYDSLCTFVKFDKCPYKMFTIENNKAIPLFTEVNGIKEPYNKCRQALPDTYNQNGYIYIFNTSVVKDGTWYGKNILPYIMDESIDIDYEKDMKNI
jgi:CMP-N-acetylneuraminic acid synthetase